MWMELLAIAGGFALLTWSADRFVTGASGIAFNLKVSPLIIGLTIVSLGTSAPEILVSVMAAMQGNAGLAIGNAIGSNIINTGLILGITAVIVPLSVHSSIIKRELPVMLLVMALALLLLLDGTLGRFDGAVLLSTMALMLIWMVHIGRRSQTTDADPISGEFTDEIPTSMPMGRAVFWLVVGGLVLAGSSRMLVWGAVSVAHSLGVSDLVIGLTIVALGTSLPELAASVMSAIKKEHDIALGNIIGSNIFNILAVLGLPGLIDPGPIDAAVLTRDYPMMLGLCVMLFVMAYGWRGPGRINRLEGAILVACFCGYQTLLYFSELAT
mgnify:CR=1 FL=1